MSDVINACIARLTGMPAPDLLLKSAVRLLRPLIRLLIQSGVTFPVLADAIRELYVAAAQDLLPPADRSDSRLHVMTGIHRKEIRRLRMGTDEAAAVPFAVSISSQVIGRWLGSSQTTDSQGRPLALPRMAADDVPSFDALVRSVTTDIRPRTVLDEWLSQGLAIIDPQNRVVLQETAFVPSGNDEAKLFYFGRNLHDHVAAAAANVAAAAQSPFLDRSVHYDRLSPEAAHTLEQLAREAAQKLLLDINRVAMALADQDRPDARTRRVNLGVYLYVADDRPDDLS